MCGFFCTNLPNIPQTFTDVESRGWETREYSHREYTAVQSQLPCYTGKLDFSLYECDDYIFSFVGEIYNVPRGYASDTEYMRACVVDRRYANINGQYAFVLYNKHTYQITVGRDPLGQVPVFIHVNGGVSASTTLPTMVHQLEAQLDPQTITRWCTSKHYTSLRTQWLGIDMLEPGVVNTYTIRGRLVTSERVPTQYHTDDVDAVELLEELQPYYSTPLESAHIVSGGIDSTVLAHTWGSTANIGLDHVGKDWVSNTLWRFHQIPVDVQTISQSEWCEAAEMLISETYTIPYSWSWVGYWLLGERTSANVLYTGEGADEIFGGYPDYPTGTTPYSTNPEHDSLRDALYAARSAPEANKLLDTQVFVPVACTGANLALGCHTVEPRNPYLDHRIVYNTVYQPHIGKPDLTRAFVNTFGESRLQPKQGFGGWPDEFSVSESGLPWPAGAWDLVQRIF
jgi:asparagine synthetase B (glutamine-hydrolysing)